MSAELLQIGEFAKRAATNLRTLRYYDEMGLIRPAQRSPGRFRMYTLDQIHMVAGIKRLQGLGLSLGEIREIMVSRDADSTDSWTRMTRALDQQIELIGDRLSTLQREIDELAATRAELQESRPGVHEELGSMS